MPCQRQGQASARRVGPVAAGAVQGARQRREQRSGERDAAAGRVRADDVSRQRQLDAAQPRAAEPFGLVRHGVRHPEPERGWQDVEAVRTAAPQGAAVGQPQRARHEAVASLRPGGLGRSGAAARGRRREPIGGAR